MSLTPIGPIDLFSRSSRWAPHAIISILIAVGALTVLALPAVVVLVARQGVVTGMEILAIAALLIGVLAACGLLIIGIIIYRQIDALVEKLTAVDQQTAILAEQSMARTQAHTYAQSTTVNPVELRTLLERIHEVLLLPEQERAARYRTMVERELGRRLAVIDHLISTNEFHQAREELTALSERFGQDRRLAESADRLEKAANAALANDVTRVTQFVKDVIAQGRWDEAERTVLELARKYPSATEPNALLERLRQEKKKFEQLNRQRMHDEIQQFVNQKRWQEAQSAARKFIETFPAGPDTDVLRNQLPTLEANAEIQSRQTLERYIKQYIQKQQYWDALALARRILNEYPLSPQANALRGQIGRLEELARRQAPQS
ncbi:MAG: hypothetical protein QUV05_02655 [Phycisphaerae bacterium]|jgi:hypothetical protein|nr:hypothetical protein [Phycisphaerae bacterium]